MTAVLAGRYRLEEPVGTDPRGGVWRATDLATGEEVMVTTAPVRSGDADHATRADAALSGLFDPDFPEPLDSGVDGDTAFVVDPPPLLPGGLGYIPRYAEIPLPTPAKPTPPKPTRKQPAPGDAHPRKRRPALLVAASGLGVVILAVAGANVLSSPAPVVLATPRATPASTSPTATPSTAPTPTPGPTWADQGVGGGDIADDGGTFVVPPAAGSGTGRVTTTNPAPAAPATTTVAAPAPVQPPEQTEPPAAPTSAPPPPPPPPPPAQPTRDPNALPNAIAKVASALEPISNPGARNTLGKAWASASGGLTAANADGRLAGFAADVAGEKKLTDADKARINAALDAVRAALSA